MEKIPSWLDQLISYKRTSVLQRLQFLLHDREVPCATVCFPDEYCLTIYSVALKYFKLVP